MATATDATQTLTAFGYLFLVAGYYLLKGKRNQMLGLCSQLYINDI